MCFNISDKRCDATCKFHWVGAEVGMINYWVVSWNKSSFAGFPIIVRIIMMIIILINDHPENHLDDHLDDHIDQLKTCWSWNSGDQAESDEVLVSDQDREVCQEVCRWNIKISYKWLQINNQQLRGLPAKYLITSMVLIPILMRTDPRTMPPPHTEEPMAEMKGRRFPLRSPREQPPGAWEQPLENNHPKNNQKRTTTRGLAVVSNWFLIGWLTLDPRTMGWNVFFFKNQDWRTFVKWIWV